MSFTQLKVALSRPEFWGTDEPVEIIETHISCVFLAGNRAYKVKKPVDLGFVDFTTLERRRFFCDEELRLNRRLAPDLYLGVVAIGGSDEAPVLQGGGPPIEYAVEMVRFAQEDLLAVAEEAGRLTLEDMDRLAAQVADFHGRIPVAGAETPFGDPDRVCLPVEENFRHLLHERLPGHLRERLERLQQWTVAEHARCRPHFAARKRAGRIRECHGDMHLGNMILQEGRIVIFDCIEFNDDFRWIDVISEVAFCTMDLEDRGQPELAHRFLNAYLEQTGDYGGLSVLRYYLCYRAMVRAKVAWLRLQQQPEGEAKHLLSELAGYVGLAEKYALEHRPALILMHGVSGTGKSFGAQRIVDQWGAVRVRSDVERKRMAADEGRDDLYTSEMTRRTYERLKECGKVGAEAGWRMILDATFLRESARRPFLELADRLDVPCRVLNLFASEETLRQRVRARQAAGGDVSDADVKVLEMQLGTREELSADERRRAIDVDTERPECWSEVVDRLREELGDD